MGEAILRDRVLQRTRDMRLTDQIVERLRPIFSGENLVTHALNLNGKVDSRKLSELIVDPERLRGPWMGNDNEAAL
jgi:hypothetical protein